MKLKYFELDMPYVKNQEFIQEIMNLDSLTYEQAVREDYTRNWKARRREFSYETKCITSMFERLLKPINTKDCWKIIIECVDEINSSKIMNLLGAYTFQVKFNFTRYHNSTDLDKKKMILSALAYGVNVVFEYFSIPYSLVEPAVKTIEDKGYENIWEWKKKKVKSTTFLIQVEHSLDCVRLFWVIRGKNSELKKLIKVCPAHEMDYGKYLGKLAIDNNFVCLLDKNDEVVDKISVIEN